MTSALKVFALAALLIPACADGDGTDSLGGPLATGGAGGSANPSARAGDPAAKDPAAGDPNKPGAGCNTPPAPGEPIKCWAEEGKEGTCKVCVDATGKEVVRSCAGAPPSGDPNGALKCFEERGKDGEICKVCVDASGKEIVRGCVRTTPPDPSTVKCEEVKAGDTVCKVCYDANGTAVSKECAGR